MLYNYKSTAVNLGYTAVLFDVDYNLDGTVRSLSTNLLYFARFTSSRTARLEMLHAVRMLFSCSMYCN